MLKTIFRYLLFTALALAGVIAALFGYLIYGERQAEGKAKAFCASIRVGEDPLQVLALAARSEALKPLPPWHPVDGPPPKTLEVLFKGAIPLSAHGCQIQAGDKVTSANYFHTR